MGNTINNYNQLDMNKTVALVILFQGIVSLGFSQFKNPSESKSQKLIERKILYVQDFFDNDEQKQWFVKYWKFDQKINFVNSDELKLLVKEKRDDIAIISAGVRDEAYQTSNGITVWEVYMIAIYLGEDAKNWNDLNVDVRTKKEIFKLSTTLKPSLEQDFKFIGQHFHNYIINANGSKSKSDKTKIPDSQKALLKNKTLLVPMSICKLSESEIKNIYSFPFKLVTNEYIYAAILNEDKDESYIKIIYSDKGFAWSLFCIDAESGKVLNEIGVGGVSFGMKIGYLTNQNVNPNIIKESHLKWLDKRIKKALK